MPSRWDQPVDACIAQNGLHAGSWYWLAATHQASCICPFSSHTDVAIEKQELLHVYLSLSLNLPAECEQSVATGAAVLLMADCDRDKPVELNSLHCHRLGDAC